MTDNLIIKRIWQDTDFFQIKIECQTDLVVVKGEIYTTDKYVDDLHAKIGLFLSGSVDTTTWQNGERGISTTPCISFTFSHKDELGHVLIEVYMEIDDGGLLSTHNCCFFVNTEIGLLFQFKEKLPKLKTPQLGIQISLNDT